VPYAERQVTLSRFLNGSMLALVMAGPVGGVFGEYVGWRGVFLLLAAAALVLAAALARRLPALPDPRGHGDRMSLAVFFSLARRSAARTLLLCAVLDGALLLGCFPFLAPYLHERFALSYAGVGLILSCFGLGALAYTRVVRWLVPHLGEANLLLAGGTIMSAALAAGMAAPHWAWFVPVQFALGFGFYLLHGVMQVRATEMLPQARATAVSAFAFMLFMGQSLGALAIGAAIARLEYRDAFLIQAGAILAFGVALRVLMRRGTG
jgi:predicted MFS family arabinose efflux permease